MTNIGYITYIFCNITYTILNRPVYIMYISDGTQFEAPSVANGIEPILFRSSTHNTIIYPPLCQSKVFVRNITLLTILSHKFVLST